MWARIWAPTLMGQAVGLLGQGPSGLGGTACPMPSPSLYIHSLAPLPLPPWAPTQAALLVLSQVLEAFWAHQGT